MTASGPAECSPFLSRGELERYKRQLMHDGFTVQHQLRLKEATVLVGGVGGVGGAAASYLAMAGIGRLRLAHYGNLTLSNMNRQTLMRNNLIGHERITLAMERIHEFNPEVEVEGLNERITPESADRLLDGADMALSARPNFRERRLLNASCVEKGIPMIEAAMNGMEGYLFTVVPRETPCLHCLFPEDDPAWEELGFPVFGAISGMLGCLMAIEAIKLLTGFGKPLRNKMLVFNAVDMEFRKMRIHRDNTCSICGG